MDAIKLLDHRLFLFFNRDISNPFFDWLMPIITDSHTILLLTALIYIVYIFRAREKKDAFLFVGLAVLVFAMSDLFCYRVLKPYFGRLRPSHAMNFTDNVHNFLHGAHFLLGQKSSYSFPSNHAANAFGQAIFWTMVFPKRWFVFIPVAALIAFTRVYCGVHYPADITFGALVGAIIGLIVYSLLKLFYLKKRSDVLL